MANEIRVTAALECINGNYKLPKIGGAVKLVTQSVRGGGVPGQVLVPVAGVEIDLSGLTTPGWGFFRNTDPDNFVYWGPKVYFSRTITNKALTTNVATLTAAAHGFTVGDSVVVDGVDATFDGTYTITAVTANTFSYAKTAGDVGSVASGGTAVVERAEGMLIGKLLAGEEMPIRLHPSRPLWFQADTADCKVQIVVLEN